jgi:hypothetical protein
LVGNLCAETSATLGLQTASATRRFQTASATGRLQSASATCGLETACLTTGPDRTDSADRADLLQIKTNRRAYSILCRRAFPFIVRMQDICGVAVEIDVLARGTRPEKGGW